MTLFRYSFPVLLENNAFPMLPLKLTMQMGDQAINNNIKHKKI